MTAPSRARILVVHDEPTVARELAEHLREFGYDVPSAAATGDEALEIAKKSRPDLALLDVRIGGARDVVATANVLREGLGVPVVYLSGQTVDLRSAVEIALQRGRLEREQRAKRSELSTTLHAIRDAVVSVDASGAIVEVNRAACSLGGWSLERARGRPFDDLIAFVDHRNRAPLENPLAAALGQRVCSALPPGALLLTASGSEVAIDGAATPLHDDGGRPLGALLVLRDVSEERRLERQAELNGRLAALGTLAAGVTQEIDDPLAFVIGNQQHAQRELGALRELFDELEPGRRKLALELVEEIGSAIRDAMSEAERVRSIVSELTKVSRPPGPQPQTSHVPSAPRRASPRADLCARLLFVDDEPILLDALTRALEGHFAVDRAPSALAALELLAAGNEYDLLVCDLMMPSMTGMDLFHVLEQRFPDTARRTVFMTGGAFTLPAQAFIGARGRRVLEKPFTNDELFAFIAACLKVGGARAGPAR